jgi:hypothetical protein
MDGARILAYVTGTVDQELLALRARGRKTTNVAAGDAGWYLTFGHPDWMAIGEFPDEKAAASAVLAAAAGGSLSDIETTVAMTAKDAHATFEAAGKAAKEFRSAGRS